MSDPFQVLGHIENPNEGVGYYKVRIGNVEGFVVDVRLARR
jgi:hypothetical protein